MEKDEIEATAYVMDIKETTFAAEKKKRILKMFYFVVPPSFGFCLHQDPCLMLFTTISIYILVMGLLCFCFFPSILKIHLKEKKKKKKKRADTKECLMMIASKKF